MFTPSEKDVINEVYMMYMYGSAALHLLYLTRNEGF